MRTSSSPSGGPALVSKQPAPPDTAFPPFERGSHATQDSQHRPEHDEFFEQGFAGFPIMVQKVRFTVEQRREQFPADEDLRGAFFIPQGT